MRKITNRTELKRNIQELESRQIGEWILLKEQLYDTYERLKPVNFIKRKFEEIISSPGLKDNLIDGALGLTTGFVARKIFTGKTSNPLTKLMGIAIEMIVANKVTKHADVIKGTMVSVLQRLISKNKPPVKL